MKYQVISTDEYGQTSILNTVTTVEAAVSFIDNQVMDLNFANALTTDDQLRSIEAYSVHFLDDDGNIDSESLYSGNTTDGKPRRLIRSADGYDSEVVTEDVEVRIFIGKQNDENMYLNNPKGEIVSSLSDINLEGKTEFFIRVV